MQSLDSSLAEDSERAAPPPGMHRRSTVHLSNFSTGDPSNETTFETRVRKRMEQADADGDGQIELPDLFRVLRDEARVERRGIVYRKLIWLLVVAMMGLVILMGVLDTLIIAAFKDVLIHAAKMSDVDGRIILTSPASTKLPLLAAPVLRAEQLAAIESLSLSLPGKTAGAAERARWPRAAAAARERQWSGQGCATVAVQAAVLVRAPVKGHRRCDRDRP